MFSGFCGLFDKDHKNNVINHQKLIVQMSEKIIGYKKEDIFIFRKRKK